MRHLCPQTINPNLLLLCSYRASIALNWSKTFFAIRLIWNAFNKIKWNKTYGKNLRRKLRHLNWYWTKMILNHKTTSNVCQTFCFTLFPFILFLLMKFVGNHWRRKAFKAHRKILVYYRKIHEYYFKCLLMNFII